MIVASSSTPMTGTAEKSNRNHYGQANGNEMLTVEKPKNKQRNCDNSLCSIDSGRSSVKQKSVANSSYQKRRLSCESLKNDQERPAGGDQ